MFTRYIIYARNSERTDYVTEFRTQESAEKFMQEKAREFQGCELYCVVKHY